MQEAQDKDTIRTIVSSQPHKRSFWLTSLGTIAVAALSIGLSITAFAYWHAPFDKVASRSGSSAWERVLDGYNIFSITTAPNNLATLYACGIPLQPSTSMPYHPRTGMPVLQYALLSSTDSGTHWQEVTRLNGDCQIAISPTNSNDIYAVALADHTASNGQVNSILKHSTNGGHSWTDILPTFVANTTQSPIVWQVQQLSRVGNRLFGIQWIPLTQVPPLPVHPMPPVYPGAKNTSPTIATRLTLNTSRLVESSDGGYTWTVIDSNLGKTEQETRDYVVSPSDSQTIYELAGMQWPNYRTPLTPKNMVVGGNNLTLYKTTDGGGTWIKLLENQQNGSKVQLASNDPSHVYVGASIGVVPLASGQSAGQIATVLPHFSLTASTDSGATWYSIKPPTATSLVQNWFVSADGQVYAATGSAPSGQPTVTGGTVMPSSTSQIGPGGYKVGSTSIGAGSSVSSSGSSGGTVSGSPVSTGGSVTAIQRYDTTNDTWSTVTQTPASSSFVAVTANTTQKKVTLWLMSNANGKLALYKQVLEYLV